MFLSLFNSFALARCPPDGVCLQDPPFWRSRLPSLQNYTSFVPPSGTGNKPKMAFYVSIQLLAQATVLPAFFDRPDFVTVDVFGVDLFGKSFPHFRILNLYNLWTQRTSPMTVSPLVAFPETSFPTLVVGYFNFHHPLPDPLRSHSADELANSFPYFSRSSELGFSLLNQPGVYTRFPLGGSGRPSVLDLSFASPLLLPFCQTWDTPLLSTGSDHVPVQIIVSHPLTSPPPPSPKWSLTDGPALAPLLKDFIVPRLLLSPPDSLLRPGSSDTSRASPPSSPPTRPPNAPLTARSPAGPHYFPSSERNSTPPQGRPAPPSALPTVQPPTSLRKATSRSSRPPRQLTGGPS